MLWERIKKYSPAFFSPNLRCSSSPKSTVISMYLNSLADWSWVFLKTCKFLMATCHLPERCGPVGVASVLRNREDPNFGSSSRQDLGSLQLKRRRCGSPLTTVTYMVGGVGCLRIFRWESLGEYLLFSVVVLFTTWECCLLAHDDILAYLAVPGSASSFICIPSPSIVERVDHWSGDSNW